MGEHLPSFVVVALAGGLVAAFYLGLYWAKRYNMPIGWDTPRYLDQVNLVAAHGLHGVPQHLPPPIKTLPSRGGFPIVVLSLASLFGVSTFKIAAVAPPAAAAAMAMASGALLTWTLRRGPWSLGAATILIGTSAVVVRLMAPETYSDNLFGGAILVAALVPLVSGATGQAGAVAAALLLAAGAVAHAPSFGIVAIAIGLAAIALVPRSWRAWRRGEGPLLRTPSMQLGTPLAAGAALAAGVFAAILRAAPDTPKLTRGELTKKLREDVPMYRYWLTAPLAALGGWALWRRPGGGAPERGDGRARSGGRRTNDPADRGGIVLLLLACWTVVALAGILVYLSGRNAPAHRFLSFLMPLPILVAAAVLWAGTALAGIGAGGIRRMAGVALVVAAIAGFGALGYHDLYGTLAGPSRGVEWLDPGKVQDAATAASYLDAAGIPDGMPVVFVIDDQGSNPLSYVPEMTYMLRAVLPANRVPHVYVYVGNPEKYLAGRPTYRRHPKTYDVNANRFWPTIERLLPERPVALLLSSYNPMYRAEAARHPGRVVAPGVVALSGPRPASPVPVPPIPTGPRGAAQGALLGAAALIALTLTGWGWSLALLRTVVRPFESFALAPAFGLAFLIFGGIVSDALGLRLMGAGGALTAVGVAAAGWWAATMRRRPGPDREPGAAASPTA